uniref:Uncharacterized protein n=1 Tax=Magallana gigas TaxID=29159 RepID=A0A8W8JK19_MAGGI
MGLLQSCFAKNNKVGVMKEEAEVYEKVRRAMVTEDVTEKKDDQENVQSQKQKLAQQRREEALLQKKIEVAHKEMERLEKYVNLSVQ